MIPQIIQLRKDVQSLTSKFDGMDAAIESLQNLVELQDQLLESHAMRLDTLTSKLSPKNLQRGDTQVPYVGHPVPGDKGWTTSKGAPIEILGFDKVSGDVWCRFPKSETNRDTKRTYRYPAIHWERYWHHVAVSDSDYVWDKSMDRPYHTAQDIPGTAVESPFELETIRLMTRLGESMQTMLERDYPWQEMTGEPLNPRLEIFMRQTLAALSTLMLHHTGTTSIVMTAFDPPLAPVPGGPRFVPPPGDVEEPAHMEIDDRGDHCPSCGVDAGWIGRTENGDFCEDPWHGGF